MFAIFDNNVWFGVRERVWSVSWLCPTTVTKKDADDTCNYRFLDGAGHTNEARWTMHGNMPALLYIILVPVRRCSNLLFCVLFRLLPDLDTVLNTTRFLFVVA